MQVEERGEGEDDRAEGEEGEGEVKVDIKQSSYKKVSTFLVLHPLSPEPVSVSVSVSVSICNPCL